MKTRSDSLRNSDAEPPMQVLPQVDASGPSPPSRTRGEPAVLLAATAIGVVLFAGLLALAGGQTSNEAGPAPTIPAPPLAATAESSVAGRTIDATDSWDPAPGLPDGAKVLDVLMTGRGLVAAGSMESQAAVWVSVNGQRWNAAVELPVPPGSTSRVDVVAGWEGYWIAVGAVDGELALWRTQDWQEWAFEGSPADLADVNRVGDIAAGAGRFWLVGSANGHEYVWVSSDGIEWERHDSPHESGGAVAIAATTGMDDGEWLFVAGSRCRAGECRPALWKTRDGRSWIGAQTLEGLPDGELSAASGVATSVDATANRVVVVGSTSREGVTQPAVWTSTDGVIWSATSEASRFPEAEVRIRLREVGDGESPVVSLLIAARLVETRPGDVVTTEVGELTIVSAARPRAVLRFGGETIDIGIGSLATLRADRAIDHVAIEQDRIVVTGYESGSESGSRIPIVWVSLDGGAEWEMHRLPGFTATPVFAGLRNHRMMALSGSGSSWVYDWDVDAAVADAVATFMGFAEALATRDLEGTVAWLPLRRPEPGGVVQIPGMPPQEWFEQSTARLDIAAVEGATEFLDELNATLQISECRGGYRWSSPERVRVECQYRISSDLVSALGLESIGGELTALVASGRVVSLTALGSDRAWESVASWARTEEPESAVRTFGTGELGATPPQPSAELAAAAMDWARRYRALFMEPGETVVAETPLGQMEWSLLEPFDGAMVSWLARARDAFWAVTVVDGETGPADSRFWSSDDGTTWEPLNVQLPAQWVSPIVFSDRLFVTWGDRPRLSEWNGSEFTDVELESPDSGEWWVHSAAESGDQVLLIGSGWDEAAERDLGTAIWALGEDDGFRLLSTEIPKLDGEGFAMLVGTDSGFVLLLNSYWSSGRDLEAWGSVDGVVWELLTDDPGIEGSVEWVGSLGDELIARVWVGDECETVAAGSSCGPVWEQWRSTDGRRWERDSRAPSAGYVESFAGPMGMVAVSQPDVWWGEEQTLVEPTSVWLAAQGESFTRVGHFRLGSPLAGGYWVGQPAMSSTVVAIPINTFSAFGLWEEMNYLERSWLLVGKLIAP